MSDYRRFVSYLYEYRNGQKNQNCGFLKAELRNDLFRLEMHVKDSALSLGLSIKIYGFIRKENRLPGILLGNAKSGNGIVNCYLEIPRDSLHSPFTSFSALNGIIVLCSDTVCYASAWDDLPIIPTDFTVKEETPLLEEAPAPSLETEEIHPVSETPPLPPEHSPDVCFPEDPRWEQASSRCKTCMPFRDGFLNDCLKLDLNALSSLRKDQWPVGSNPFILRAFSRYQHLILGRLAENNRVILGIPGSYHPSEKFMAEMYGFPYFKAAGYPDNFPAAPGYWYRILD